MSPASTTCYSVASPRVLFGLPQSAPDEPSEDIDMRNYILKVAKSDAVVAAAGADHTIKLYNGQTFVHMNTFRGHNAPITGIEFGPKSPSIMRTSSEDGIVSEWDMRSSSVAPVVRYPFSKPLLSLSTSTNEQLISASCDDVICVWDTRNRALMHLLEDNHMNTITGVRFVPDAPAILASGACDGLICICDLSVPQESDDHMISVLNLTSAIADFGFWGKSIWAITGNESLTVWDWDDARCIIDHGDGTRQKLSVHGVAVDYLIKCLPINDNLLIFSGDNEGQILGCKADDLHPVSFMSGGHSGVVRDMAGDKNSVVSGGEDSALCMWADRPAVGDGSRKERSEKHKTAYSPYL